MCLRIAFFFYFLFFTSAAGGDTKLGQTTEWAQGSLPAKNGVYMFKV